MMSAFVAARRSAFRRVLLATAAFMVASALPLPAHGQLWLPVGSQLGINQVSLGVHAAWDLQNNVYLVVGANNHVTGVFTNLRGEPVTGPIPIKPLDPSGASFGAFARVSYSPHLGGFLVVWPQEGGGTVRLHMRTVAYPGNMGPVFSVTDSTAWLAVAGPAVAYSPTSQRFLIAYKTLPPAHVRVQAVAINGAPAGPSVQISSGFGRDPGVAWNPYRDEFGVSFSGESNSGGQFFSVFVRVPAMNPAGFARTTFNQTPSGMTAVTNIDFNVLTNRYVMVWWEPGQARASEISDLGVPLTMGTASFVVGAFSYDALDAVRNPLSGTFLLTGLSGAEDHVGGAELNGNGFRISADLVLSPAGPGQNGRYTRVSPHMNSRRWLVTFSRNFAAVWSQVVATQSSGGGAPGSHPPLSGPPPPPPPPPSDSDGDGVPDSSDLCPGTAPGTPVNASGCPTQPPPNGGCTTPAPGAGWVCVNGGWLPPGHPGIPAGDSDGDGVADASDLCPGTPPGTAVDANGCAIPPPPPSGNCTTPQPGPGWVCVNGGWLPPGHPGIPTQSSPAMSPNSLPACQSTIGAPASGWIRVGDGWVPPSHPASARGSCKAG